MTFHPPSAPTRPRDASRYLMSPLGFSGASMVHADRHLRPAVPPPHPGRRGRRPADGCGARRARRRRLQLRDEFTPGTGWLAQTAPADRRSSADRRSPGRCSRSAGLRYRSRSSTSPATSTSSASRWTTPARQRSLDAGSAPRPAPGRSAPGAASPSDAPTRSPGGSVGSSITISETWSPTQCAADVNAPVASAPASSVTISTKPTSLAAEGPDRDDVRAGRSRWARADGAADAGGRVRAGSSNDPMRCTSAGSSTAGRDSSISRRVDVEQMITPPARSFIVRSPCMDSTGWIGTSGTSDCTAATACRTPPTADSRERPFWRSTPSLTSTLPDQFFVSMTKMPPGPTTRWSMFAFCRPGHAGRAARTSRPPGAPPSTCPVARSPAAPASQCPADRSSRAIFSRCRRAISSAELPALVVMAGRLDRTWRRRQANRRIARGPRDGSHVRRGWIHPSTAGARMRRTPDAERATGPSVPVMDTTRDRDRHHRRRPGGPGDRLPPAASRPPVRDPRRRAPGSATTGAGSGTRSSSTPPPSTTACPACRSPRRSGPTPARTRSATTSRRYARHFELPVRLETRVQSARARTASSTSSRPTAAATAATTWWSRPARSAARRTSRPVAGPARPVDPAAALQRVPPARPAPRRPGAGRRRQPLRDRHRLRGRRDPPDDPGRPRLRPDPAAAGVAPDARDLPGAALRVAARRHPAYADRPQGDAGDPLPRRPDAPGQARGPGGPRRRAGHLPGRGGPGRPAGRRRDAPRGRERRLGDRLPAGLRLDPTCRSSARTASRGRCAAWSPTPPGCSSAASASSTPSARCCSPARAATRRTSSTGSWRVGRGPRGSPRPPDPPYARSVEVPAMGVVELEQARAAFDRGDWEVAFDGLVRGRRRRARGRASSRTWPRPRSCSDTTTRRSGRCSRPSSAASRRATCARAVRVHVPAGDDHRHPRRARHVRRLDSRAEGLVAESSATCPSAAGSRSCGCSAPSAPARTPRPPAAADEATDDRTPPPRPGPDRPGPVLAGTARALRGSGRGGPRAARRGHGPRHRGRDVADHRRPRLLHRDRGLPGDQRLRAGWRSGPPRSSAGARRSRGCSPSPASARSTGAS